MSDRALVRELATVLYSGVMRRSVVEYYHIYTIRQDVYLFFWLVNCLLFTRGIDI